MTIWQSGPRLQNDALRVIPPLIYAASWGILIWCIVAGISRVPNEIVGGAYSNTDGEWLRWNTEFIFAYGAFLDTSPFNAFSGMGSIFPPNLPWLNPGALALALPIDRVVAIQVSYALYALQIGVSIVLLSRVLGLPWGVSMVAAQLHIIVLFPPFSRLFVPIEWYSAAPIYAHLSMVLNLGTAAFVLIGRSHQLWKNLLWMTWLSMLVVIGLLSAPFNFVFFFLPYIFFGLGILIFTRPDRGEILWKIGALGVAGFVVLSLGFPDYLQAMSGTSARVPSGVTNWSAFFSFGAWWDLFRTHNLCADPYVLICTGNPIAWFQALGLVGAVALICLAQGQLKILGGWGITYTLLVHFYDYLAAADWLAPLGVLSTRYVSWSSYSLIGICAVAGSWVALAAFIAVISELRNTTKYKRNKVSEYQLQKPNQFVLSTFLEFRNFNLGTFRNCTIEFLYSRINALRDLTGLQICFFSSALFSTAMIVILSANILNFAPGASSQTTDNGLQTLFSLWWWIALILLGFHLSWIVGRMIFLSTGFHLSTSLYLSSHRDAFFTSQRTGAALSCVLPIVCLSVLPSLGSADATIRQPRVGPILQYLVENGAMDLGDAFPGYVATVWSEKMDDLEPYHQAPVNASFRYIGGRIYFDRRYGTTFTETDLGSFKIPTFEEYGQWVSQQSQKFALTLMGSDGARARPEGRMLRIYEPDFDLMRTLGIRFVVTDVEYSDEMLTLRATQASPGSLNVYLYEIATPNLATYSPTTVVNMGTSSTATLAAVDRYSHELNRVVVTNEHVGGPFYSVDEVAMTVTRDGYHVTAASKGRTLLLLPIQFSNCLQIVKSTGEAWLLRANFLQTLLVFDQATDVTIRNMLGLFGNAKCGLADVEFSKSLL